MDCSLFTVHGAIGRVFKTHTRAGTFVRLVGLSFGATDESLNYQHFQTL